MRQLSPPFVVAAPEGARIRTSVFTAEAEHGVLAELGARLGCLANRDLAARCAPGRGPKHKGRAERKRALTPQCSSRWAGSITRRTDDMWERQMLNYRDELVDKQAAVAAITERLAKPVGESGGYRTKQERFAKQQRRHGVPGTHRHQAEHAETPTRRPAKHHGQGTANCSRRPPSRQRKPTATN